MMARCRRRWQVLIVFLPLLVAGIIRPSGAETEGESADQVPTDARIERLREAIERERKALAGDRERRRSMEDELERARDELERTREQLDELEREANPGADTGD